MFPTTTAARVAVAGLTALALAATGSPALADATKPTAPVRGSFEPHSPDVTELLNGEEQTLPASKRYKEYVYLADFIYWSVTAVRSEGGKPGIRLYADEAHGTLLTESTVKKQRTDFVVVDGNHAPVGVNYYPAARSRAGASTIEVDNDAEILFDDTPMLVPMTDADVVKSVDVFLEDGFEYVLTVSGDGDGDAKLFLMQSNIDDPTTHYQGRRDAVARSDNGGAGGTEEITVTGTGDWYGLILINESGSGTYTFTKTLA